MLKIFKQNIKYFFVDYIEKIYIDIKKKRGIAFITFSKMIYHTQVISHKKSKFKTNNHKKWFITFEKYLFEKNKIVFVTQKSKQKNKPSHKNFLVLTHKNLIIIIYSKV